MAQDEVVREPAERGTPPFAERVGGPVCDEPPDGAPDAGLPRYVAHDRQEREVHGQRRNGREHPQQGPHPPCASPHLLPRRARGIPERKPAGHAGRKANGRGGGRTPAAGGRAAIREGEHRAGRLGRHPPAPTRRPTAPRRRLLLAHAAHHRHGPGQGAHVAHEPPRRPMRKADAPTCTYGSYPPRRVAGGQNPEALKRIPDGADSRPAAPDGGPLTQ